MASMDERIEAAMVTGGTTLAADPYLTARGTQMPSRLRVVS